MGVSSKSPLAPRESCPKKNYLRSSSKKPCSTMSLLSPTILSCSSPMLMDVDGICQTPPKTSSARDPPATLGPHCVSCLSCSGHRWIPMAAGKRAVGWGPPTHLFHVICGRLCLLRVADDDATWASGTLYAHHQSCNVLHI